MPTEALRTAKAVRELLLANNDAFELSYALDGLLYDKKKGHMKPCFLAMTTLNVYVLKDPSYELVKKIPLENIRPRLSGETMVFKGVPPAGKGADGDFYVKVADSAHRNELVTATARVEQLAIKLEQHEAIVTAAEESRQAAMDENDGGSKDGDAPGEANDTDEQKRPGAQRTRDQAKPEEGGVAGGRRFLVNNIASADFVDYSAIRSVYPVRERDDKANGDSKVLVKLLQEFIDTEQTGVEQEILTSGEVFMASVESCEALQPHTTRELKEKIALVTERVYTATQNLHKAGKDVVSTRQEYKHLTAALLHTHLCHNASVLHRKAEQLAHEKKYYPSLLASKELETCVQPLLNYSYGNWVFYTAVPALRALIKSSVHQDLNSWLTTIRRKADTFGHKALEWASNRIQASNVDQRKVELVDDEVSDDGSSSAARRPSRRSSMSSVGSESGDRGLLDDWADDLLWDVQHVDTPHGASLGAQFLEHLTDLMVNPTDPNDIKLSVVHTAMRVFKSLDPDHGETSLQRYYTRNRARQLTLRLETVASLRDLTRTWLAGVTGFFFVDLVVMQSTHPRLVHDYHIQGLWEQAAACLLKWLVAKSEDAGASWEELLEVKAVALEVVVALEEHLAVGGGSSYRLDPLYEGISRIRAAAINKLHEKARNDVDDLLKSDKYQLVSMMAKPDDELCRKLFLHLNCGSGLPRCSLTVLKIMDILFLALDAGFRIYRGAGDVDDEVRGHVESLLVHLACQLDERTGKLMKTNTLQIFIQSTNAAAFDAAALALSQEYAVKASSSSHVRDGRLQVFAGPRRQLRHCQKRFESRGTALLAQQIKEYMETLQASMWCEKSYSADYTPLTDLKQKLVSSWAQRQQMLSPALARRTQQ
eukprot:gene18083-27852_t